MRVAGVPVGIGLLLLLEAPVGTASRAAAASAVRLRASLRERVLHKFYPGGANDPKFEPGGGMLDTNVWKSNTMANDFRVLDDLEPIAPMDRIAQQVDPFSAQSELLPGSTPNNPALYLPPYLKPDAFPVVHGPNCYCTPSAAGSNRPPACTCSSDSLTGVAATAPSTYQWTKISPVPLTSDYVVSPADPTFPNGNYWLPVIPDGGVVAPSDRMPLEHYPAQAPGDSIHVPTTAREDKVVGKFVRYIDQVESRSRECDYITKECTTPCYPTDLVNVRLGNYNFAANVVRTFVGNAVSVRFAPSVPTGTPAPSKVCGLSVGCTAFRPCFRNPTVPCEELHDKKSHNFAGNLVTFTSCPWQTTLCMTVEQVVGATFLRKDGRTCRAAPEPPPTPPT